MAPRKFRRYVKLSVWGAVCSLAFAPFFLFFTFFWGFKRLLENLFHDFANKKEVFFTGFAWGFGYFLGSFHWVINPLLFDFPRYAVFIPPALVLIPSFLGCYIGLIFFILHRIRKKFNLENRFALSIIFSGLWVIFELCKSYLFFPFPFNLIAHSLGFSSILMQTASIFGSYALSFFTAVIYCGYFIFAGGKTRKIYAVSYSLLILFIAGFGIVRLVGGGQNGEKFGVRARLVQPNFGENVKNNPNMFEYMLGELISDMGEGADIVFLPETSLPFAIINNHNKNLELFKNVDAILSGAIMVENDKIYNSIALIENEKVADSYNKIHLVPFGEYLPLRKFLPGFLSNFVGIDFSKGDKGKNVLEVGKIGKI
ncbi:MAG: apolipoprotein N-acyltransferase, partial [Rickettsiales bacterium]|nr:apolipoprotein N-acyltransferase [Rickettsiales bacterium]